MRRVALKTHRGSSGVHARTASNAADAAVPYAEATMLLAFCQAAAQRFADNFEALLQRVAANPTAPLPGFSGEPVNCISLSAMRCAPQRLSSGI